MVNQFTQCNIDQSYADIEKSKIGNAIATSSMTTASGCRRRLCAQSRAMVISTYQYFMRKRSTCPILETSAACMIPERTVKRIVQSVDDTQPLTSCKPKQLSTSNTQRKLIDHIYLDDWVQDLIRVIIEQNFTSKGFAPNVDEILVEVLKAFPDKEEMPYRSRSSFHRVLKVSVLIFIFLIYRFTEYWFQVRQVRPKMDAI
jgi:hypothetical protein